MYEDVIKLVKTNMETRLEGEIMQAVMRVGVDVDKDELIKALAYDREQYQKGYRDGQPQWISVKERLPEMEGKYIVCTAKGSVYCAKFSTRHGPCFHTDLYTHITHWMPLPEPPEEE